MSRIFFRQFLPKMSLPQLMLLLLPLRRLLLRQLQHCPRPILSWLTYLAVRTRLTTPVENYRARVSARTSTKTNTTCRRIQRNPSARSINGSEKSAPTSTSLPPIWITRATPRAAPLRLYSRHCVYPARMRRSLNTSTCRPMRCAPWTKPRAPPQLKQSRTVSRERSKPWHPSCCRQRHRKRFGSPRRLRPALPSTPHHHLKERSVHERQVPESHVWVDHGCPTPSLMWKSAAACAARRASPTRWWPATSATGTITSPASIRRSRSRPRFAATPGTVPTVIPRTRMHCPRNRSKHDFYVDFVPLISLGPCDIYKTKIEYTK